MTEYKVTCTADDLSIDVVTLTSLEETLKIVEQCLINEYNVTIEREVGSDD